MRITPEVFFSSASYFSRSSPSKPMDWRLTDPADLSRRRKTIFSPWTVGMELIRRSISLPLAEYMARPSWGIFRSEMFMPPMIFRREITVACRLEGTVKTLRRAPSMRIRTTISPSWGSR